MGRIVRVPRSTWMCESGRTHQSSGSYHHNIMRTITYVQYYIQSQLCNGH
jgi:hypothetical protein